MQPRHVFRLDPHRRSSQIESAEQRIILRGANNNNKGDKMKLTDGQKRENKIAKFEATLRCLTYGNAKNNVAKEFQKLVRLKAANCDGMVRCVTCGKRDHWKNVDAGHFHKRRHEGTLFDVRNVAPQCKFCNDWKGGNDSNYAAWMEAEYTKQQIRRLAEKAKRSMGWTMRQLAEMKLKYLDEQKIELKRLERG